MIEGVTVSIMILTYNQEQWIRQTLDSILAQKTTYSYEVIIGEDCSTDGTHAICEEYVEKYANFFLAPQTHNLGLIGNWANCAKYMSGKYHMGCAGDDYWTNPDKIQMQVDYMEQHPECVICHTDYDLVHVSTGKIERSYNVLHKICPPQGKIQMEIRRGKANISAGTQCTRAEVAEKYVPFEKFVELEFPREDWPTQLILSKYGEIHYLPIATTAYRVGQESITNMLDYDKIRKKYEKDYVMAKFLYDLFPEWGPMDQGTKDYYEQHVYHGLLLAAYRNNDYRSARQFRHQDPTHSKLRMMAYTRLTFQVMRWCLNRE